MEVCLRHVPEGWGHDCHVWQVSIHGAYMYAYLSRMHHFFCFFLVCAGLGPSLEGKHAWCIHVYVCIPIKHKPFFVFPPCMRGTGCRLTRQGAGYLHPVYLFITGMRGTGWRRTRCSRRRIFARDTRWGLGTNSRKSAPCYIWCLQPLQSWLLRTCQLLCQD